MPPKQNPTDPGTTDRTPRCWRLFVCAIFGLAFYLAYSRLHLRANQLVELAFYPLLGGIFAFEWARYQATKKASLRRPGRDRFPI